MSRPSPEPSLTTTPSKKLYTVGTLTYTRMQLAQVFAWLLLGDFCLHLMDNGVIPTLVPLQFEALGAKQGLYSLIMLSVVNVLYVVLVPIVSTWSDRTRTRIGRRRPFLLITAPILALVLILLGFSTNIARFLANQFPFLVGGSAQANAPTTHPSGMSPEVMGLALGITVVLFIAFKLLDLFPQSVYYYLWPDVIPPELMGTFGALFRVFYAGGSLVFNWFLIGLAKEHPEEIYLMAAGLYLVAFLVMVWRVKEPEYPPPPPLDPIANTGFMARVQSMVVGYFRDCFSHPFYWKYFLAMAVFQCAYQPFIANLIFFGRKIYGADEEGLKKYGGVMGTKDLIWIGIYLALVPIMTKLHPLKAAVLGYVLMTAAALAGTLLIHDEVTFRWIVILTFATVGLYLGGTAAIGPRLLPKEKYGQFVSAGALVFRLSVAIVGAAAGYVFQIFGERFVFMWLFVFLLLGTLLTLWLYWDWKRLGGEKGFTPP